MPRKKIERGETNAREKADTEAPVAQFERDFWQKELRAELDAMLTTESTGYEKRIALCLAALVGKPIPLEREFWYAFYASDDLNHMGKFVEAEQQASRCSEVAAILNSYHLKANVLYLDALICWMKGVFSEALLKIREGAELLNKSKDEADQLVALGFSSVESGILSQQGKYGEAIAIGVKALQLAEKLGKMKRQWKLMNNLGLSLFAIGAFDDSISYHLRTAALTSELGYTFGVAGSLCNVANAYNRKGNYVQAKHYHEQALDVIRSTPLKTVEEKKFHVNILTGLAADCEDMGFFDQALEYANEVLVVAEQLQDRYLVTKAHVTLCHIFFLNERYEVALSHGLKANEYNGEWTEEWDAYIASYLSDAYTGLGNFPKAFEFEKKARELENGYSKAKMDGQLEYQKHLQKESAEKTAEILRLKERELSNTTLQLVQQTELLATFREDLRRIIRKIEVRDPAINELIAKLRELPEAVNWKEFEEQFRQVHPEFKVKLKKKFPELSEDELQVCALFRLKLKSPDIGKLLSISDRTVQNRRYRIRKKLGLKTEDDIAKFLGGF